MTFHRIFLIVLPICVYAITLSPMMFLSSKTPYYPQQDYNTYEVMPNHCRLVHINHLARHGSRHSTKLKAAFQLYDVLADALRLGKLTTLGFETLTWTAKFIEAETINLGKLTHDGKVEHMEIAERLWRAHGASLLTALRKGRRIVFEATHKSRALGSQEAFLHGFADAALAVDPDTDASEWSAKPEDVPSADGVEAAFQMHDADALASILQKLSNQYFGIVNSLNSSQIIDYDIEEDDDEEYIMEQNVHVVTPPDCSSSGNSEGESHHYAKLRFFDTCAAYARYKKDKNWLQELEPYTVNATRPTSHENIFLRQLFTEDHLLHLSEVKSNKDKNKKAKASRKPERKNRPPLPAEIAANVYSLCQIQANAYGIFDQFCGLFDKHLNLMAKNELLYDLHDYYKQGAGDATAFAMSCVLLEDFLSAGDEGAGLSTDASSSQQISSRFGAATAGAISSEEEPFMHRKGHTGRAKRASEAAATTGVLDISAAGRKSRRGEFAHFRFGHSETVMPFISMLGLYQEPSSPSLHDYYHSRLAKGTSQLLGSTYRKLQEMEEAEAKNPKPSSSAPPALQMANTSFTMLHPRQRQVPFDAATMVTLKHPWSGARLIPMAANVQWLLYDCGDKEDATSNNNNNNNNNNNIHGLWVKMLHNEREIQFPACTQSGSDPADANSNAENSSNGGAPPDNVFAARYGLQYPCPWEVVKDYYRSVVYDQYGITTCDASDWIRICGGVDMNACKEAADD